MAEIKEIPIESYADCIEKAEIISVHNYPGVLLNVVLLEGRKTLLVQANDTFLRIAV
jgi:hypothetical protein